MSRPRVPASLVCRMNREERTPVFEYRAGEKWPIDIERLFLQKLKGCLLTRQSRRGMRQRILASKVLVFTGHHFVEAGGEAGEIGDIKLGRIMGYRGRNANVRHEDRQTKLIILTGCNTLKRETARLLAKAFPEALVIGFAAKSTLVKGEFFPNFVKRLPTDLKLGGNTLEVSFAQHAIAASWRAFIKDAEIDPELSKGAYNRSRVTGRKIAANPTRDRPAYMMPGKRVWVRDFRTKKWREQAFPVFNRSEKEFWGGRSWPVPDPRYE